jgi:hypothetical protein
VIATYKARTLRAKARTLQKNARLGLEPHISMANKVEPFKRQRIQRFPD